MTRTDAIKRLLELGPLEIEALLLIMGGDREQARAALGVLMLTHQVYCSKGWYQLNRPRGRTVVHKPQAEFALQGAW